MEELIPFLLFTIFVVLSVIGKVKRGKKKHKSAKAIDREGLAVRIHTWLTDLQKRIETQTQKAPKGILDWEKLIGRSQSEGAHPVPYDDGREDMDLDAAKETPSPLPKTAPIATPPQPRMSIGPSERPTTMAVETPRMPIKARRKPMSTMLPTDRAGLRQAVIWSEILGPPIALRDPFRENR
jgi:hypothetical protein